MTHSDDQAAAPDFPASRDSAFLSRRVDVPRIMLRPSVALHLVLATAIGLAVAALYTTLAPWLGAVRAVPPTLAFLAVCGLAAAAWRREQPAVIEIGPDSIAACSRHGARIAQGRLTGASQWGTSLLALDLRSGKRRATVLIAADSLDADAFRALAVRARCAAGR
ncbi:protein YgfX [Paraburkholderia adhaesiva]|uniref:protein YgfX n=1 Tax=Paraburkholderia adhaesiva TaxID=2883244 RepID=UPI001F3B3844|nr:protein YgfX [Paraburkholderia adhaesiva]